MIARSILCASMSFSKSGPFTVLMDCERENSEDFRSSIVKEVRSKAMSMTTTTKPTDHLNEPHQGTAGAFAAFLPQVVSWFGQNLDPQTRQCGGQS